MRSDGSGERDFVEVPSGRVRVFHGTNVVVKGPPYLPSRTAFDPRISLVARDFQDMRTAGINLIRLGVMWAGAEPQRGRYNESYYDELRGIIKDAAHWGMYVLLDMHQDAFLEYFCGEGLPLWAVERAQYSFMRFPFPLQMVSSTEVDDNGIPSYEACSRMERNFKMGWAEGQGAYESMLAYESLYTDVNGLLQAWGAFWQKTASEVAGLTNVIGYELINEPFTGNIYRNPLLAIPYFADRLRLQPAYDTLAKYIREVDNETLIFFAGVTWEDSPLKIGFEHAPGGEAEANRSVFAYHFYVPPQKFHHFGEYLALRRQDAKKLGTGLMMTEACCEHFFDAATQLNAVGHSWIQWEWKSFCKMPSDDELGFGNCRTGNGAGPWMHGDQLDIPTMRRLATPYAAAVAGELLGSTWQATTQHFELRFWPDVQQAGETEVFVNRWLSFPHGFDINVKPDVLDIEEDLDASRVLLRLRRNAIVPATPVLVTIRGRAVAGDHSVPSEEIEEFGPTQPALPTASQKLEFVV